MPTMRHPRVDGPYEAVTDEQASMLRMSGWVTEDENPDLFKAAAEREQAAREQAEAEAKAAQEPQDDKPAGESGENEPKPRARRATSDRESK